MAITASRLGSAPLTIDWTQIQKKADRNDSASLNDPLKEAWDRVKSRFHPQDVGFYDAPVQPELSQVHSTQELADTLLKKNEFTDCLFLGIGGSALGPISLLSSLQDRTTSTLRFHFIENPDPLEWKKTLSHLNPATTLVCSVTKSGTTFETMAQTLLALEWLGKDRWKSHLVAITDPVKGDLKDFATHEGIPCLEIHPSIGGRFSVFSPVGLFPAALSGLSLSDFLQGAKQVRDAVEKLPPAKNPLFLIGSEMAHQYSKRPTHVCMPYSTRLRLFGNWFVQLWGESLGKGGKGFTPIAAVGATDQHSLLQLLKEGPDDKMTLFLTVDQIEDVKIPVFHTLNPSAQRKVYSAFRILEGHGLQELLEIEYRATSLVLTKQSRPHVTFRLDRLDERNLGALYFAFCTLTAFTGSLWEINPFDQPGVEEGKVYIRESLGT